MDNVMLIKEKREALGITQGDLATRMGVVRSTVTKWEKGSSYPSARQIPLLSEVLGVPIGDLFAIQPRDCIDTTEMGA